MTKGISTDDELDIWQKSLSSELELWVALGLPSEKIIRQSCGKANEVIIYSYGGRTADMWWEKIKNSVNRFNNLQVVNISEEDTSALGKLANRGMKLQINIQDGDLMVSVDSVRRQGFWNQWRAKLSESLAHLVGCIMRRVVCDESVAFRASFV